MPRLVDLDARPELLVLVADELVRFFVGQEALVNTHGERLGVGLRIFDCNVDLQLAECRTAKPLDEFRLITVWTAADVEPRVIRAALSPTQVICLDDEGVPFPPADRVAVPPGLRLALRGKPPAVGLDVAEPVVGFVQNDD